MPRFDLMSSITSGITTSPQNRFLYSCVLGVPLPPGKPVVQLSARDEPLDENSVTDEINLTWAIPKVTNTLLKEYYRVNLQLCVTHKMAVLPKNE